LDAPAVHYFLRKRLFSFKLSSYKATGGHPLIDPAVPKKEVTALNFSPLSAVPYHHLSASGHHPIEVTVQQL